jgi:hypothetical protein
MKLTKGEFCQFGINTRFQLLKEFGKHVVKRKVKMKLISVYRIFDFYVEVCENASSNSLEKIEPLRNIQFLDLYKSLET